MPDTNDEQRAEDERIVKAAIAHNYISQLADVMLPCAADRDRYMELARLGLDAARLERERDDARAACAAMTKWFRRFSANPSETSTHVGTGEPNYLASIECADYCALDRLMNESDNPGQPLLDRLEKLEQALVMFMRLDDAVGSGDAAKEISIRMELDKATASIAKIL